jgi:hypothetical protein
LGSTGFFGMTAIGRMLLLKNKKEFKTWLMAQSQRKDLAAVTVAHGEPVIGKVGEKLAKIKI